MKRKKKLRKVYRTNPDTISLNCDEFSPGWMRPRDSSFDPRLVLGVGFKNKKKGGIQKLKNEVRQKVKTIKRRIKRIQQANLPFSCTKNRIIAADKEIERFHRFFKGIV